MPLIVISGLPASGKTHRAQELCKYFKGRGKNVKLVEENLAIPKAGFQKNEFYADSQKEKLVRADLMSEVQRLLNKDDVIIFDAANYIKGYRYEVFCASKAVRSTQCTLFCCIQKERAWELNLQRTQAAQDLSADVSQHSNSGEAYTSEIFNALCMRYEEPHGNCRWDSPLFVVFPDDKLDFEGIFSALFESKPLPPNQSTQNPPLSATNYVYELDKLTQKICGDIISARKAGIYGSLPIDGSNIRANLPENTTAMQLNRLRRQFLNYSKMHTTTTSLDKVPQLFVQFLNSNFSQ